MRRRGGGNIRNLSYVHPVHPYRVRVDAKNRHTAGGSHNHVHASTPKCNVRTELTESEAVLGLSKYKGYVVWGGRMDVDTLPHEPSCDYLRPPKTTVGGRGGRLSGEVTL